MFDFMLNTAASSVSDKLAIGGEVTLLGMGTVFAVLITIWVMVEFLHLLLGDKSQKTNVKKESVPVPAPIAAKSEDPAPAPIVSEPTAPDYELIAVITAAVAAASGSSPNSFRVVSFKRANNKFAGK